MRQSFEKIGRGAEELTVDVTIGWAGHGGSKLSCTGYRTFGTAMSLSGHSVSLWSDL